jgi:nickel-dependent lactate racemase
MKSAQINFGQTEVLIQLPDEVEILSMKSPAVLPDPAQAIQDALQHCIGTTSLESIIASKLQARPDANAVIVISDNTRPVPYKGENGILRPIVDKLLGAGIPSSRILILAATGTHNPVPEAILREMLDPIVFEKGITIKNHDCVDQSTLVHLGQSKRGNKMVVNHDYMRADIKIITGLVESHFMAGASGGRKAICPGLIGEESTFVFHGARILDDPLSRDLVLAGNPCHEEAVQIAEAAGCDFSVNVTLNDKYELTGVFAGDLLGPHRHAVNKIREYVTIPIQEEYDIVVSHAGFAGINHYQAAKAAVVAIPAIRRGGKMILVANTTDVDPVGSGRYRSVLKFLKQLGPEKFRQLILSDMWEFVPDQWEVQMWARLFAKTPAENLVFFAPQLKVEDFDILSGVNGNVFLPRERQYQDSLDNIPFVVEKALRKTLADLRGQGVTNPRIAFLADGPYGIPVKV